MPLAGMQYRPGYATERGVFGNIFDNRAVDEYRRPSLSALR